MTDRAADVKLAIRPHRQHYLGILHISLYRAVRRPDSHQPSRRAIAGQGDCQPVRIAFKHSAHHASGRQQPCPAPPCILA